MIQSTPPSLAELTVNYRNALTFLDSKYAYFLTHVLNLGKPQWSEVTATASMECTDSHERPFAFTFNPRFAALLSTEQFAFVLAHQTMHLLLDHPVLARRFTDRARFELSADVVINDYLADNGFQLLSGVASGEGVIGMNCARISVGEVYDLLESRDFNLPERSIDEHGWIYDQTEDQALSLRASVEASIAEQELPVGILLLKEGEEHTHPSLPSLSESLRHVKQFTNEHRASLAWVKLLRKIHPDLFPHGGSQPTPAWHQRPRKLYGLPEVLLPIHRRDHYGKRGAMPSIVMALDTSDSISQQEAERFISLACSIPQDHIHLHACTFTTQYHELDLDKPKLIRGGTCFSAVEEFIQEVVIPAGRSARYPQAVIILTDGKGAFDDGAPAPEYFDRWHWLLSDYGIPPARFRADFFGEAERLAQYLR